MTIWEAAAWGNLIDLENCIHNGYKATMVGNGGATPMHIAAKYDRQIGIFLFLLNQGADVDARDDVGKTPLDYAYDYNATRAQKILEALYAKRS